MRRKHIDKLSLPFLYFSLRIPIIKLLTNGLTTTYIGSTYYEKSTNWGKYYYLEFSTDQITDTFLSYLKRHSMYVDTYYFKDKLHVVFQFTESFRQSIVIPFINGRYSQFPSYYVKRNFPAKVQQGTTLIDNTEYLIITKSSKLVDYWKSLADIDIPQGCEVWSRPEKKDEVFLYTEFMELNGKESNQKSTSTYSKHRRGMGPGQVSIKKLDPIRTRRKLHFTN